ncbi:hypothetical protein GDO86_002876 [Hymenochirus boettgeri]|uniref:Uncharacterized protein n=1 Tax=Hymenochirus boettgeri TaxID=247094 RepID=A0A8T2JYP9_9PIPI|nr:hypothetical protein GDO86_002876 [Hymenochirus boettgeri]
MQGNTEQTGASSKNRDNGTHGEILECLGPGQSCTVGRHKKSRAIQKKERRRRKRQLLAKLREAEENNEEEPSSEEAEDETQLEIERQKLHEEWLLREQKAQELFIIKKEKEEAAKRREEEERRLIEEWREKEERKKREENEAKKRERELENGDTWHNPEAPDGYGTEKDKANCPFYLKTGACRFGERCSRKHSYPTSSQTLLVRGMFITFGMEQCRRDDYDTDANLEYGEEEIYQQFLEFYADVVPEFKIVGKVVQFKVSCNCEPHLRGNVYVQYQTEEECLKAFTQFNGRWYAGRQLQCEFSPVTRWKTAICGLFERKNCPRGKHCNFLHVFKNPNNEFWEANRDIHLSPDRSLSERRDRSSRHDDHGHFRKYRSPSPDYSYNRNGETKRKKNSHHKKKHRSRKSRSRERRSRSRGKRKRRHKNRSRSRSRSGSRSRSRDRRRSKSRERSKSQSSSRSNSQCRRRSKSKERSKSRSSSRSRSRRKRRTKSKERSRSSSSSSSRSNGRKRSKSREMSTEGPKPHK